MQVAAAATPTPSQTEAEAEEHLGAGDKAAVAAGPTSDRTLTIPPSPHLHTFTPEQASR